MTQFSINAHFVRCHSSGLSPLQTALMQDGGKPIRIASAPTGTGKTYGFVRQIADQQRSVLLVVPTRALAHNVKRELEKEQLRVEVWDADQSARARDNQNDPWAERLAHLQDQGAPNGRGGMILATLEAFHGITLGMPGRHGVSLLNPMTVLETVDELVFDEAHLLNERAFGFLMGWATLIGHNFSLVGTSARRRTRLTLLSATHSELRQTLIDKKSSAGLPEDWIEVLEEEVSERGGGDWPADCRPIHGDVTVTLHEDAATIVDLLDLVPALLAKHHPRQVMLIHDSVARLDYNEGLIKQLRLAGGIEHEQVHVVSGHDRKALTAGEGRYTAGPDVPAEARLIIGTSAIEVGISLPGVTALVTDPGHDAASLIQRIGRVARGDCAGEVHVAAGGRTIKPHILCLAALNGPIAPGQLIERLGSLKPFNNRRAVELGSAYFAMLRRQARHHGKAFKDLFAHVEHEHGRRPLRSWSLFEQADRAIKTFCKENPYDPCSQPLEDWWEQVDCGLQDLRGFSPTVMVCFNADDPGSEASPYDSGFVESYLGLPDFYDDDILCYREPRNRCMNESPEPRAVKVLTPTGDGQIVNVRGMSNLAKDYRLLVRQHLHQSGLDNGLCKSIRGFVDCAGLVVQVADTGGKAQSYKAGSLIL